MTPREFANTSRGFSEKLQSQYRADWERARWIASVTIAPHTKKASEADRFDSVPVGK
jgi:hypothetical protein